MQINDQVRYRVRLAEGFLGEARQDMTLGRWRSCVDNSQLAVENAAKVALALLEPVGRTHRRWLRALGIQPLLTKRNTPWGNSERFLAGARHDVFLLRIGKMSGSSLLSNYGFFQ